MLETFTRAAGDAVRETVCAVGPHPTPTEESCRTAQRALELAANVDAASCLVLLVSGGASRAALTSADRDFMTRW